jgi:purine-binding chemotaxis protein CheW
MNRADQVILFSLEGQRYGVPLAAVAQVVRMVAITPLPAGPDFIQGVINVAGEIMPVVNLRQRFGLTERAVELGDQLIIIRSCGRSFALMTDLACTVAACTEQVRTGAEDIISGLPFLAGVARLPDGLILLQDPQLLLSPGESHSLDEIINREQP